MIFPSVIFGLLHFNPTELGSLAWVAVAHITLLAILMADLTMRTGNLGAAIGLHFANNVAGILFTSLGETLSGFSLYVMPLSPDVIADVKPLLLSELGAGAVVVAIYFFVVTKWFRK